ncbi:hypothetical protein E9228_002779 [Curtobacterium flaccumfaciens]|uniref:Terminase small subunit n=1 Tax=Curtobacterium salicis TaxID=1779862 RepID=A0ABX0T9C1_9MICO|nr:hypothetical protein [Curtobacterium sp. WW7]NII42121.1 hypothetical protein [Curtobacterium sp. WW7]
MPQPELPTISVEEDGGLREFRWPAITREWWDMWATSPLSLDFTATDWSELRDTALIHARYWNGDIKLAAELRLRTAKFGATPEDRARLRITFAQAEEAETKTTARRTSSRDRFGGIALPPEATAD